MEVRVQTAFFILVLFGLITLAFCVQPVKASETIYIRADGSIEPATAPIQRDGDLYSLTGDINVSTFGGNAHAIIVERSNIIIDGNGYKVECAVNHASVIRGISLSGMHNVTIMNVRINGFADAVRISSSSNIKLFNSILINNEHGVLIGNSQHSMISGNIIAEQNELAHGEGIRIETSSNNTIAENHITDSNEGIVLYYSPHNNVYGNNVTNNYYGVSCVRTYDNLIYHNNFINNTRSTYIDLGAQFWDEGSLGGNYWSDYSGIDENGDSIGDTPYIINADNQDRHPLMNPCKPWTLTHVLISTNSPSNFLGFTVDVTGTLSDAQGRPLQNKTIVLYYTVPEVNTWTLITSDKTDQLGYYSVQWIPPATGYFRVKAEWSGNITHFKAVNITTLNTLQYQDQYVFSVESNSTVTSLAFNTTDSTLSFTVDGQSGTKGYVKVTIAKTLIQNIADATVYLDGDLTNYTVTSLNDSWLLHFTYFHSTHSVIMNLGNIPLPFLETPLGKAVIYGIPITAIVVLVLFVILRKKHARGVTV